MSKGIKNHVYRGKNSPSTRSGLQLKRVQQVGESYCGPAVLEILLSHLHINASQVKLAKAVQAEKFIDERGTRVDELSEAITRLYPQVQLWYKTHAKAGEIEFLAQQMNFPVGVEWQGLFYNSVEEEAEDAEEKLRDGGFGHYSVVKHIDRESDAITLADPYGDFCYTDRVFSLEWFESRWWDVNQVMMNSYPKYIRDDQMMFILTRKGAYFPKLIGMKSFGK